MSTIKQRRLALPVTCHPDDHVGDHVPFYFCPRSIMLFVIHCAPPLACHPDAVARPGDPVRDVIAAFDHHRVVIIGESHWLREAGDFYIRLVRDPDFATKAQTLVVEFASKQSQPLLERYIAGDDVPAEQVRTIWRNTTKVAGWESPIYAAWLAAIRDVNAKLPAARRIRVIAGDSAIDWTQIHDHAAWAATGDNNVAFADAIDGGLDLTSYGSFPGSHDRG
jgi:hypothetical protein